MLLLICQCEEWDAWFTIQLKPLVFCLPVHLVTFCIHSLPSSVLAAFSPAIKSHKIPEVPGHSGDGVIGASWARDVFRECKTHGAALRLAHVSVPVLSDSRLLLAVPVKFWGLYDGNWRSKIQRKNELRAFIAQGWCCCNSETLHRLQCNGNTIRAVSCTGLKPN